MFPTRCLLCLLLCAAPSLAREKTAPLATDPPPDSRFPAAMIELTIPSHGARLPGHIYLAAGRGPHPTVVLLHGLPGNERNLDLAQALRRAGFNALFFHYRGAWGAEGEYRLTQLPEDTLAVLEWLRDAGQSVTERVDPARLSLLGHSLGGYAALAAGARDADLACVMALSPANLALWQARAEADGPAIDGLRAYADSLFMLRGLTGERFVEELAQADPALLDTTGFGAGIAGKPLLMMVGRRDQATPPATMFDPVVAAYRRVPGLDLTVRKLDDDHGFSANRLALTREVIGWAAANCR